MSHVEKNILGMIKSPCSAVCALDENDMCIGCYRTGDEITKWGAMDNDEKIKVLEHVSEREKASGNLMTF
jgi:predicted Fe-S protein YdhL (DUF1289 family)